MNQRDDPFLAVSLAYAAALEELAGATGRTRRGPRGTVLAISGAPFASLNSIISPCLDPNIEEIEALAASEIPWEFPWSIRVRGNPGPLVVEGAERHGLTHFERELLMVRHSDQGLPTEPSVNSLSIRVVTADELDLYARTVAEGFEVPHEMLRVMANPSRGKSDKVDHYLAELEGVPVGTGMTVVTGGLTGIFNVTTLPGHRRRGYGRAITTEMVRAGFAAGAGTVYLYASGISETMYASIGFHTEEYLTVITAPS